MLLLLSWANYKKEQKGKLRKENVLKKKMSGGGGGVDFIFPKGWGGGLCLKRENIYIYI